MPSGDRTASFGSGTNLLAAVAQLYENSETTLNYRLNGEVAPPQGIDQFATGSASVRRAA